MSGVKRKIGIRRVGGQVGRALKIYKNDKMTKPYSSLPHPREQSSRMLPQTAPNVLSFKQLN